MLSLRDMVVPFNLLKLKCIDKYISVRELNDHQYYMKLACFSFGDLLGFRGITLITTVIFVLATMPPN